MGHGFWLIDHRIPAKDVRLLCFWAAGRVAFLLPFAAALETLAGSSPFRENPELQDVQPRPHGNAPHVLGGRAGGSRIATLDDRVRGATGLQR
ncbi:hypothetical protein VUR80DRAFT_1094 [Thermomyces stellatus]